MGHPHPITVSPEIIASHKQYEAKVKKSSSAIKEYGSQKPYVAYNAGKQEALDNLSTEQYREAINTAVNNLPNDKKRVIQEILKNSKNGKE